MQTKVKLKDGTVNIWGLQPEMSIVMRETGRIWASHGYQHIITSARDGTHSVGSMHYYGYAIDFRTWDEKGIQWDAQTREKIARELRVTLAKFSPYFDVVAHKTHIHVEYDWPKSKLS